MARSDAYRVAAAAAGVVSLCVSLSSCMSGPTYGTDKTAMEQLADDLGSAVAIGTDTNKGKGTKYNPRPDLVLPPQTARSELAAPQQSLATRDNNPQWLETPEETRQRLVAEADANKDNPRYRSPLLAGYGTAGTLTESQKWEQFREARKLQQGAYIDQRRFLTDPPAQYRQAQGSGSIDDLGVPESQKEKERKKKAAAARQGSSWWQIF